MKRRIPQLGPKASDGYQTGSKNGKGYMPPPAPVIDRAMTYYVYSFYGKTGAIKHPQWHVGRIDFQPWPYPSATEMIAKAMNETLVSGDTTFVKNIDPKFVANDLVNYDFVSNAMNKYPEWKNDPSVNPSDPFHRSEVEEL